MLEEEEDTLETLRTSTEEMLRYPPRRQGHKVEGTNTEKSRYMDTYFRCKTVSFLYSFFFRVLQGFLRHTGGQHRVPRIYCQPERIYRIASAGDLVTGAGEMGGGRGRGRGGATGSLASRTLLLCPGDWHFFYWHRGREGAGRISTDSQESGAPAHVEGEDSSQEEYAGTTNLPTEGTA